MTQPPVIDGIVIDDDYLKSQEHYGNCWRKSTEAGIVRVFKEVIHESILDGTFKEHPAYSREFAKYREIMAAKKQLGAEKSEVNGRSKGELVFLTVNPPDQETPQASLEVIDSIITRIVKKKWVKRYFYAIECRGLDDFESVKGIHLHMVIDRDGYRPAACLRELEEVVRPFVKSVKNPHHFNLSNPSSMETSKLRIYVLEGLKKDEPKTNRCVDNLQLQAECETFGIPRKVDEWLL